WAVEPAARNRVKPTSGQAVCGRDLDAGATAIDPGFRGDAMRPERRFGAELNPDGVTFRLWAPAAKRVELMLDRTHPMPVLAGGWYETKIAGLRAGALYKYRIDGEFEVPDPASHFQPDDVDGPSEVIEHDRFNWRAGTWRGRGWTEAVFL